MNGKYVDDATKIERASPAIAQAASRGRSAVVTPGLNQNAMADRFCALLLAGWDAGLCPDHDRRGDRRGGRREVDVVIVRWRG